MKWLAAALLLALLLLQYRLWISSDGVRGVVRLRQQVAVQQQQNAQLAERNGQLAAEVRDLKHGYAALEERARSELGMISGNETFYQVVPSAAGSARPASGGALAGSGTPAASGTPAVSGTPARQPVVQRRASRAAGARAAVSAAVAH